MSGEKAIAWHTIRCAICQDTDYHLIVDQFGFSHFGELIIKAYCVNCDKQLKVVHTAQEIMDSINEAMQYWRETRATLSEDEIERFRSGLDQAGIWDELVEGDDD